MRDKTHPAFYVISGNNGKIERTPELINLLLDENYPILKATGSYKKSIEQSVVVFNCTKDRILDYMMIYNQETGLYVDGERLAYLMDTDGRMSFIGNWTTATAEQVASNELDFTLCNGIYYIVRGGIV